jgi:hypothetical protein
MRTLSIRILCATTIPHRGFSCVRTAAALAHSPILLHGILFRVILAYCPNKSIPAFARCAAHIYMHHHCGSPTRLCIPRNRARKATF